MAAPAKKVSFSAKTHDIPAPKKRAVDPTAVSYPGNLSRQVWTFCISFLDVKSAFLATRINRSSAPLLEQALKGHHIVDVSGFDFVKRNYHPMFGITTIAVLKVSFPAIRVFNFAKQPAHLEDMLQEFPGKPYDVDGALLAFRSRNFLGCIEMTRLSSRVIPFFLKNQPLQEKLKAQGIQTPDQLKMALYQGALERMPVSNLSAFRNMVLTPGYLALEEPLFQQELETLIKKKEAEKSAVKA
jgi:hypothetical protein